MSTTSTSAGVAVAAPSRTTYYAWYVAGLLAVAYLISVMDRFLLGVVLETVKADLSLSDTELGILQGPSFVTLFLLASIPCGRLADVMNRKLLITIGLVIWGGATAACGLANNFAEFFVARLIVGLGEAALMPAAMSLIAAYFSRDRLSRGVAIYMAGASLGRAAAFAGGGAMFTWFVLHGGIVAPLLGELSPWRSVFISAALIGLVFTVIFYLTLKEPARVARPKTGASMKDGLAYFWEKRNAYLAIFIPFAMLSAVASQLAAWSVSFYVREHGMAVADASSLIGITGLIIGPTAALTAGWLNDKLRVWGYANTQPTVLTILLPITVVAVTVLMLTNSVVVAAIFYAIAYFMVCLAGPTGLSGVQLLTPDVHRGTLSSIALVFYSGLAAMIGPLIVGLYGDLLFGENQLGLAMLASTISLAVIGIPFGMWGRKPFKRTAEAIEAESAKTPPAE